VRPAIIVAALVLGSSQLLHSQQPVRSAFEPRPIPNGVLGSVPFTEQDSIVDLIVQRLDFDSYKELLRGLTEFGDRMQGSGRDEAANAWIEAKFREWGYTPERLNYEYTPGSRQGEVPSPPEPRSQVYATKIGSTRPGEMYIISGHMDGRGGGEGANDNASGTALVMELARVLASPDIQTDASIRFALWNNEETGLNGARAYIEQRQALQGIEEPRGSGRYPEPRWLGNIQHDKVLFDHGNPVQYGQVLNADVDIEYQLVSEKWEESSRLAVTMINANRKYATDYPAAMSNSMSNTDSTPFMDIIPAISVRENRRLFEIGRGSDPHWHQANDLYVSYSDLDFLLGFNAAQTTLGATAELVGATIVSEDR